MLINFSLLLQLFMFFNYISVGSSTFFNKTAFISSFQLLPQLANPAIGGAYQYNFSQRKYDFCMHGAVNS